VPRTPERCHSQHALFRQQAAANHERHDPDATLLEQRVRNASDAIAGLGGDDRLTNDLAHAMHGSSSVWAAPGVKAFTLQTDCRIGQDHGQRACSVASQRRSPSLRPIAKGGAMPRWPALAVAVVLAAGLSACRDEPESDVDPRGTASFYDGNIHDFLPDYIDQNPKFMDDELEFWVKEGKVSARGSVDSEEERTDLDRQLRRVPAVRDVDVSGVSIGGR
jgi:hypothetical protein